MTKQRVALVTGASSGFGDLIATNLIQTGMIVYGTSRQPTPDTPSGVRMRVLDVSDAASVAACVGGIIAEAGRVDVLVNNAGRTVSALVEETAIADAEALFQTNFFGAARVTAQVLPHMRDQGSGILLFISSLAGLVGTPGQAYYSATKHALEGYAESLYVEVRPLGVNVVLIEPGFFRTAIHDKATPSTVPPIPAYATRRAALDRKFAESVRRGDDPQKVARLVTQIVGEAHPRLRYRVGNDAVWVPRFKQLLPERWFLGVVERRFGGY
ncbi:MAG: SDR family NAD(P)-dependent oxidoreductase [Roseiflexaceae bacterium]|nr:SDR family NAD(P)-dependent oxidoreductase [Roseiflexaceae bacterium]